MPSTNYVIISDIHTRRSAVSEVLERRIRPIDALIFCGDGLQSICNLDGGINVLAVAGNCDGSILFPADEPEVRMVQLGEVRVLMMHGHTFDVKWGLSEAIAYAAKKQADVLLYGHTHAPYERLLPVGERLRDGTVLEKPLLVANPGSLGAPRGGEEPSFGVLTVRGKSVLFSHGRLK